MPTLTAAQMEKALSKYLLRHHPQLGRLTKVKYSPRRKIIFEARRSHGKLRLLFSTRPTSPKFQTHLKEAVRALHEIHFTSTHAISVGRTQGEHSHADS